ncbi:hypothetical protein CEXT_310531 [Caerostris extrusa]|uniref:Uncharacterized protein n=1 Tax=Caerostris extrusa TaxID=172846 RepID=A0AAV4V0E2_CAEEX|nr:hypothetical protein CEXT_310531 [Caerostris extrusa]
MTENFASKNSRPFIGTFSGYCSVLYDSPFFSLLLPTFYPFVLTALINITFKVNKPFRQSMFTLWVTHKTLLDSVKDYKTKILRGSETISGNILFVLR